MKRVVLALILACGLVGFARPAAPAHADSTVYHAHVTHYDEQGPTYSGAWTVPYWTASCGPDYHYWDADGVYHGAYLTMWDGTVWHCTDRGGGVYDGLFDFSAPGDYSIDARYDGTDIVVSW